MHRQGTIHGDPKGVSLQYKPTDFFVKVSILVGRTGHTYLADSGLLIIASDSAGPTPSDSPLEGEMHWWMDPDSYSEEFNLKRSSPGEVP